ncbi:MAG: cation diffusion facilitator family transporter [Muribaculaceae bacterium]|nr:cation diffusion facilitator family transporter [Muribaculaceae bacterium]
MNREKEIFRVTLVGSIVNVLLTVFKFVAGIVGRSSAMTADAIHSLSDLLSDAVVMIFVKLSGRPVDSDHDYGHGKYETLATIIVALMLAGAGLWLAIASAADIFAGLNGAELPEPTMLALVAAVASVAAKEGLYRWTIYRERRINSPLLVANAWHHRSDALTSVAAIIGISGAMFLGGKWRLLDPGAAFVVSWFILAAAWKQCKPAIDILLEKALPPETKDHIRRIILETPGVKAMHHLRTRNIGPGIAIECHIKLDPDISLRDAHEIASQVEKRLRAEYGRKTHVGIHMEPY